MDFKLVANCDHLSVGASSKEATCEVAIVHLEFDGTGSTRVGQYYFDGAAVCVYGCTRAHYFNISFLF